MSCRIAEAAKALDKPTGDGFEDINGPGRSVQPAATHLPFGDSATL